MTEYQELFADKKKEKEKDICPETITFKDLKHIFSYFSWLDLFSGIHVLITIIKSNSKHLCSTNLSNKIKRKVRNKHSLYTPTQSWRCSETGNLHASSIGSPLHFVLLWSAVIRQAFKQLVFQTENRSYLSSQTSWKPKSCVILHVKAYSD